MKTKSNLTLSGYRLIILLAAVAYCLGCFLFPEPLCFIWLKGFPVVVVFCCMLVEFFWEMLKK